eukprot:CAMPEP_0172190362 /NCGR_PEP_ID=MMETSP1050-20130122/23073_1 /TAXON_ID=233186 /ORGANISM="Cryptomonas curvata, Strain CCAP979/52" /LENGTH=157 /DNA_ID=CAMNT_0012865231 /DNA_START=110 /DNA_END=580 /DNA_ORIENTATION=-
MTFVHARNLGAFVLLYKALLALGRIAHAAAGRPLTTPAGTPAEAWHALLAGWIGGMLVWSKYSSVNEQIALYLLSRVVVSFVKMLAVRGVAPFSSVNYGQVYPYLAAGVWAVVMWLYEAYPKTLQPSLESSMRYLYADTNTWPSGPASFLPSAASAA